MEPFMPDKLDSDYLFVCGYTGSGKSFIAKSIAEWNNAYFVEISDIVKDITQMSLRSEIGCKPELDVEIIKELKSMNTPLVVSGVRQQEILDAFPGRPVIWVDVPQEKRGERITSRSREKDDISIQSCDDFDDKLGVGNILNSLKGAN